MAARVGGRNLAISWFVGLLCAAIIGALLWFSLPAGPGFLVILEKMLAGPGG